MAKLRSLWARFLRVFGSKRIGHDIDEELESHITAHTEDGIRAGLSPA